jgi:Domain of unknown function (DUF6457)
MNEWLARRAAAIGVGELSEEDQETLLDLARIAAHTSGDRTTAPLLCYLLGIAHGGGRSLEELAETVRSTS